MSQSSLESVNRYCRDLAERSREFSDRELLSRFAATRDATAFAVLLQRHGPLVRGVCRRILRDDHRADDVVQAVFLVLAEKAGSLQRGDLLANWLFGVARRLAHRAKRQAARLERRERVAAEARPEAVSPPAWDDLLVVLEEELRRLPAKFRGPLLACYHQGRTQDEAARDFGWHVRTLRRRLAKGRELLRSRMERRGATLTAGLFAAALAPSVADAALPAALRDATLTAVLGGPASDSVKELSRRGLNMLALTKLKVWAGIGLIVTAILTAGGIAWRCAAPALEAKPADPPPVVAAQPPRSDDPLPDGAVARLGTLRLRHGGNQFQHYTLTFGPDDKTLVSGGDQFLRQWQVSDGAEKNAARFESKLFQVATLTTSDGKTAFQVVATEKTAVVHVFDTVAWKKVREIELTPHPAKVDPAPVDRHENAWARSFVVAPDAKWIGTITGAGRFATWDTTTGKQTTSISDSSYRFQRVMAVIDGEKVAAMSGTSLVQVLDLKTKYRQQVAFGGQLLMTNDSPCAVSPEGKTLAIATQRFQGLSAVRLVPLQEGGADGELDLSKNEKDFVPAILTKLVFTPDGKTLVYSASGAQAEWGLLPLDGKDAVRHPAGPIGTIATLALSHDGKTVATCSATGVIRLWDAAGGKERSQPDGHRAAVTAVALLSNESAITASADATIRHWDTATGKQEVTPIDGGYPNMTLSPNGRWLVQWRHDSGQAGGSGGPRGGGRPGFAESNRRDLSTAQILATDTGEVRYRLKVPNNWAALFSGGNSLITLESDGTPKEWDLNTGKKLRVGSPVASGQHRLSRDGEILVTVDSVCVGTNMSDGKERFRWGLLQKNVFQETLGQDHAEHVTDAANSPDGKTIALGVWRAQPQGGRVALCELDTGKILHEFDLGGDYPTALAFAPDGKTLVAAAGSEVRVWDAASGKLTRTLRGHRGRIDALAFNPGGQRLATASADTTVLIWDMSK